MRLVFGLVILLNAALLFLVQPMVAKALLPVFGGAPAVWLVSMVFFQAVLLVGYGYAHVIGRLSVRYQALGHLILFGLGWFTIPLGARVIGSVATPIPSLLATLALTIGPAYALVSPNSPLLQRWYGATAEGKGVRPYFLYSASNVGSLIGLLGYPFVIEPWLTLREQFQFFGYGFAAVAVGIAGVAAIVARSARSDVGEAVSSEVVEPVTKRERAVWMAYAAVPSGLLLGVTATLTYNIAPIPLLWVVPLSLYLLTYTLGFSTRIRITSVQLGRILPLVATPLLLPIVLESSEPIAAIAAMHLVVFTLAAWMCHRRLSELAPHPSKATEFYFFVALGGVLGSATVSIVFPLLAKTYVEYPLFLALACLLRPSTSQKPRNAWVYAWPLLVFLVGVALAPVVKSFGLQQQVRVGIVVGIPAILAFIGSDSTVKFGLSMVAVVASAYVSGIAIGGQILSMQRSFFGVHRVVSYGRFHQLVHGNTVHGRQSQKSPETPLTYYHPTGPIGQYFTSYGSRVKRAAFVGLGVGSLAAYGQPGMTFDFYEIDPSVAELAQDPKLFTFLRDCKAAWRIVLGDGRQELEKSDGIYDAIVLDAFTSDSIPSHLVTTEAMQGYLSKLNEGGVVAYHLSNRYLSLQGVVAAQAEQLGMQIRYQEDFVGLDEDDHIAGKSSSVWMLVARRKEDFDPIRRDPRWDTVVEHEGVRPWTDDYSNLLDAFIRHERE